MNSYDIFCGEDIVGNAWVTEKGLYTYIECCCRFATPAMYRVCVSFDEKDIDLGICILEGNVYTINKRIPTKYLQKGIPQFRVLSTNQQENLQFILVKQEVPFSKLCCLMNSKFCITAEGRGLLVEQD